MYVSIYFYFDIQTKYLNIIMFPKNNEYILIDVVEKHLNITRKKEKIMFK